MKKTIIGVLMIVISLAGIVVWEMLGREKVMFEDILVATDSINEHQTIQEGDISIMSVYNPDSDCLRINDYGELIGKEATQYIHKEAPIYKEYFTESNTGINDLSGESIYTLTANDLSVIPPGVTKGAQIELWYNGSFVMSVIVVGVKDSLGLEIDRNNEEANAATISYIEIKATEEVVSALSEIKEEGLTLVPVYR